MKFERTAETKIIKIMIYDDDPSNDDLIGLGEIDVVTFCGDMECEKVATVSLKTEDGDDNGTIDLKVQFSFEEWK